MGPVLDRYPTRRSVKDGSTARYPSNPLLPLRPDYRDSTESTVSPKNYSLPNVGANLMLAGAAAEEFEASCIFVRRLFLFSRADVEGQQQ